MSYNLVILPTAFRELERLPSPDRKRVAHRIDSLASQPRPFGSQKLKGSLDQYRIRQGDYRIIYRIDDASHKVIVYGVAHRKDAYR